MICDDGLIFYTRNKKGAEAPFFITEK